MQSNLHRTHIFKLAVALFMVPLSAAHSDQRWVQVRESSVRVKPVFYSSAVSGVRYGDSVSVISEDNGWAEVQVKGKAGFLPLSTVTATRVVLSSKGAAKILADGSDIVLAGKGFSKEIEEQYKRSAVAARFDLVDKVERQCRVTPREVEVFVGSGGLQG
jgi:uncharacterized protein YgiM (DUF1202 family)